MADNVTITHKANSTPPDGTIVATDQVGTAHIQRVKLDVGGGGLSVPVVGQLPLADGLTIAKGEVAGHSIVHKFGAAPDFDTTDNEVTIWDGADDGAAWELMSYVYSSSADIDSISSSNAGDTVDIEISGLDANYDLTTQTATLSGQTRVALTTPLIRVFRMINVGATNLAGNVFGYPNTGLTAGVPTVNASIRAIIQAENNQTEMAIYTIPHDCTGYVIGFYAATAGASKDSNYLIKLYARPFGQVFQLKHKSALDDSGTSQYHHKFEVPTKVFAAKTDIAMTVQMLKAAATAATISAGFDIILVAD